MISLLDVNVLVALLDIDIERAPREPLARGDMISTPRGYNGGMRIAAGKVVDGRIELDADLPEGTSVTVLALEGDETFEADPAMEKMLLEAIARPAGLPGYADSGSPAAISFRSCARFALMAV